MRVRAKALEIGDGAQHGLQLYCTQRLLAKWESGGILPTAPNPKPECGQEPAVGLGLCQAVGLVFFLPRLWPQAW